MGKFNKGRGMRAVTRRKLQRNAVIVLRRFKQILLLGSLAFCVILGTKYYSLKKEVMVYRDAVADMRVYQVFNGMTVKYAEKDPKALVARYKFQIDQSNEKFEEAVQLKKEMDETSKKWDKVAAEIIELDLENASLIKSNEEYYNRLVGFQNRQYLYDKYSYALYDKAGKRNDITFDQLKTGEDILISAGLDPNILWGLIITESGGHEDAKNSTSSATGYGQVLHGTGRSVYENIMGNGRGSFNSSMLLDGDTNVKITSNYLVYLKKNSSTIYEVIDKYAGEHSEAYYEALDKTLKKGGTSLEEINENTYVVKKNFTPTVKDSILLTVY